MAYRKKAEYVTIYQPNIIIVPECEHPEKLNFKKGDLKPTDIFWEGKNKNKGLGVFSYSNYTFQIFEEYNPEIKSIIPLKIKNDDIEFILFAIWANNPDDYGNQYVGQIWKAIHYYEMLLNNPKVILIGDFNSNSIWDKNHNEGSHSEVVDFLEKKGIFSTYHIFHNQKQGKEEQPTLFIYRHRNKPYHIDYCFLTKDLYKNIHEVYVGDYRDWIELSDHMPLVVDIGTQNDATFLKAD